MLSSAAPSCGCLSVVSFNRLMDAYVLLDPFAEIQDCLYTVSFVSIETSTDFIQNLIINLNRHIKEEFVRIMYLCKINERDN